MFANKQREGIALILLSAAGYAFLPIAAKWAYADGLTPMDVVTWRFIVATPCIWLLVFLLPKPENVLKPSWKMLLMGMMFAVVAALAFFCLDLVPASTFTVLAYTAPTWVAVLSMMMGEKLPSQVWVALGMTLIGIMLTVPDFADGFSNGNPLGILLGLMNAFIYAIYLIISNRLLRGNVDKASASALSITGSLMLVGAVALVNGLNMPETPRAWLSVIGVGTIATVIPIFGFLAGMERIGAPRAIIVSTLEPVLVLILSAVLLSEVLQPIQIVGSLMIIAGPIVMQVRRRRRVLAPVGT